MLLAGIFIEKNVHQVAVCAQHCSRHLRGTSEQDNAPSLQELTF